MMDLEGCWAATSNFISKDKVFECYSNYIPREEIVKRITNGSIVIGKPKLKSGERLKLDSQGRYCIGTPIWLQTLWPLPI